MSNTTTPSTERTNKMPEGVYLAEVKLIHCVFERMSFSEESQLIPNAERSRKSSLYGKKAKMAGFPRIFGQRERGFLQRKERFSRQAWSKKRLKYDFSRQENEENLTDISNSLNSSEEIAHEEATNWYLNRNRRRRMAMCEQLEKLWCDGSETLYDLRKALVVQRRIQGRGDGGCNPPFGQNFLVIFFLFFLKNN